MCPWPVCGVCVQCAGRSPLFVACMRGHVGVVRSILAALAQPRLAIYTCDVHGVTPLQAAARRGHVECVQALVGWAPGFD